MLQQTSQALYPQAVTRLNVQDAAGIPALGHTEAEAMAGVELERFLALLETLTPHEWERPTICPLWNVRQIVAHQAGTLAAHSSFSDFRRASDSRIRKYRKAGMSMLDAINQLAVDEREQSSPAALLAELREFGPRSIAARKGMPALLRALRLPLGLAFPFDRTWIRVDYLTDVILTCDMWMHRMDICLATGREMLLTPEHDRRMVALVMRDLAQSLSPKLGRAAIVYELSGPAGGAWRIGRSSRIAATIQIDVLEFNLLASGRLPAVDARQQALIDGDESMAMMVLNHTKVTY